LLTVEENIMLTNNNPIAIASVVTHVTEGQNGTASYRPSLPLSKKLHPRKDVLDTINGLLIDIDDRGLDLVWSFVHDVAAEQYAERKQELADG
jgi:hypothetical protein